MSGLVGQPGNDGAVLGGFMWYNDQSLQPADYRTTLPYSFELSDREIDIAWPRSRMLGADIANIPQVWDNITLYWEWCWPPTGQHTPKKIAGVTKDSTGASLGGCTVLLFNTATNLFVDTVVSASDGAYQVSDPNNVACFVVADKAGGTEVAGVTNNNLIGA